MISVSILLILGLHRIIFPYTRISLASDAEDNRPNYEPFFLAGYMIIFIVCVTAVLWVTWRELIALFMG